VKWDKYLEPAMATIIGGVTGAIAALVPHGFVLEAAILGATLGGAARGMLRQLFVASSVLAYAIIPHSVALIPAVAVLLGTAAIYKGMRGSERPSQ